jgi:tetraacyldisaccharide 4'-kinase
VKYLLLPFSWIYGLVIWIRNLLFDLGVFKQIEFPTPTICIGNLSVGGTGKSPHTIYLAELLRKDFNVAILSRGYGRKSKGFFLVQKSDTAMNVGDEPLQYASRFDDVLVAVCESRVEGVKKILEIDNKIDVILLDDAFQHRHLKPGLAILLTKSESLYVDDLLLPAGSLREYKAAANRADIIIATKCDFNTTLSLEKLNSKLGLQSNQTLFQTAVAYDSYYSELEAKSYSAEQLKTKNVFLITGIANPEQLINHTQQISKSFENVVYADHHEFTVSDLVALRKKFDKFANKNSGDSILMTTKKDFMRLKSKELASVLKGINIVVIDISIVFKEQQQKIFDQQIIDYVTKNKRGN